MHIIFGKVTYWNMFILSVLKYFKFKVFYLYIYAKTNIKRNEIASKLKNNDILVLSGFGVGLSWGSCIIKWKSLD